MWQWNVLNLIDCENMKNIRRSQASLSINYSTGLSKTSLSLWVSLKWSWWWDSSLGKYYWFNQFSLQNMSNVLLTIQLATFKEKTFFLFFVMSFDILIFWLVSKNCSLKNEECVAFPESRYINSNPIFKFVMYVMYAAIVKQVHIWNM